MFFRALPTFLILPGLAAFITPLAAATQAVAGIPRDKDMKGIILIYAGASLPFFWGIAHLFPTGNVVKGFGEISRDNRRIITMEWIIEGVALIFIGLIVATVTAIDPAGPVSTAIYFLSAACLVVLAVISLFTGIRIDFLPFRLCPAIFLSWPY